MVSKYSKMVFACIAASLFAACQMPTQEPPEPTRTSTPPFTATSTQAVPVTLTHVPTPTSPSAITPTSSVPSMTPVLSEVCRNSAADPLYSTFPPTDGAGKIAYSGDGVTLVDPQTSEAFPIHPLTELRLKGQDTGLPWSPDGNLLSFVFSPEEATAELQYYLLVADLSAGVICPLLPDLAMVSLPVWSPDGKYLAVNNGDKNALMVIPLDDLDSPFIIEDVTSRAPPSWYGPDRVAYGRKTADMVGEIVVQPLDQSAPSLILTDVPWLAAFAISPDGRWLAYDARGARVNDLSSGKEVYRGDPERYVRAWSPTGDLLLLSGGPSGSWVLNAQEGFSRLPVTLFGSFSQQSFSPDERYLVCSTMAEGVLVHYLEIAEISTSEIRRLEIPDQHPFSAVWNPK